jgi:hypothetical protein
MPEMSPPPLLEEANTGTATWAFSCPPQTSYYLLFLAGHPYDLPTALPDIPDYTMAVDDDEWKEWDKLYDTCRLQGLLRIPWHEHATFFAAPPY